MIVDEKNTSVIQFMYFMFGFQVIALIHLLAKIYIFGVKIRADPLDRLAFGYFWFNFVLDFALHLMPITCYILFLINLLPVFYAVSFSAILLLLKLISSRTNLLKLFRVANSPNESLKSVSNEHLNLKLIRWSISLFRCSVFIIACITILGVDFKIFPIRMIKTKSFGFSLMDCGVGYFIICHSMRLIRNSNPANAKHDQDKLSAKLFMKELSSKLWHTFKRSGILLSIGIIRLVSVKLTKYTYNVGEYGVHWNFFFTIVFVKIIACPFEVYIKQRALRAFCLSILVGAIYQYFLSFRAYTDYLLDSTSERTNLIDANKEGIYSSFGYLSIYLAGHSICLVIKQIIFNSDLSIASRSNDLDVFKKCIARLFTMAFLLWIALEFSRFYVQNISRRMCNLSFVLFITMSATFFWFFYMLVTFVLAKFIMSSIVQVSESQEQPNSEMEKISTRNPQLMNAITVTVLDNAFTFINILDSKFIGLFNFLLSNVLTGLINLSMKTRSKSSAASFLIISVYVLVTFFLPFLFYLVLHRKRSTSQRPVDDGSSESI